jgi:hypothetical protein
MVTLKFITDGTPRGSHVYVVETGEEVKNVRAVHIDVTAGNFATMKLEVIKVRLQASGKSEVVVENGNLVINELSVVLDECNSLQENKISYCEAENDKEIIE